jgi:hypothetical protein
MRTLGARRLCSVGEEVADWPAARAARLGTVVDQDPLPGAKIERRSLITIWIRRMRSNVSGWVGHGPPGCGATYVIVNLSDG